MFEEQPLSLPWAAEYIYIYVNFVMHTTQKGLVVMTTFIY